MRFVHPLENNGIREHAETQKVLDSMVPPVSELNIVTPADFAKLDLPDAFETMTPEEIQEYANRPIRALAVRLAPILAKLSPEDRESVRVIFQDYNIPSWPADLNS